MEISRPKNRIARQSSRLNLLIQVMSLGLLARAMGFSADNSTQLLIHQARQSIDRNDFPAAMAVLDKGKARDSRNVVVLYLRGYVLYRQRRLDLAKQDLKVVLSLAPPALQSRYILGRIAELEHQNAQAIK